MIILFARYFVSFLTSALYTPASGAGLGVCACQDYSRMYPRRIWDMIFVQKERMVKSGTLK